MHNSITDKDRAMARQCLKCPVCGHARRKQRGVAFWLVRSIESRICPFCMAYEKVYGRKAHEPAEGYESLEDSSTR